MAKKITSGKRDREKTKLQKKQDKQKKKEERQKEGTASMDDMFAYVDLNGVIHTTPPANQMIEETDSTTIEVSVPKRVESDEADAPLNGIVEHFNQSKGYGFIKDTASNTKYFFHISSAPPTIAEGQLVTFETENGPRGINATNISITNK